MRGLKEYFRDHSYARMDDLKHEGFHTRQIEQLLQEGWLEKVGPGLYRPLDLRWHTHSSFVDVCNSRGDAVICLMSALDYHDLSTIIPREVCVAIPQKSKKVILMTSPVRVFYFSESQISWGIDTVKAATGSFRIFDVEKTICDTFRFRNKYGEDIAIEALKNYLARKDRNVNKLNEYAKRSRIRTVINPYLKALLG